MEHFRDWISKITKTLQDHPKGMTVTEISRSLKISRNSISKYLDIMRIAGQIDMRRFGPAKVYYLSQRVPISALLNFSSDSIIVLDEDLRIIQVNDNLLKLFNLKFDLVMDVNLQKSNIPLLSSDEMIKKIRKARAKKGDVIEVDFNYKDETMFFKVKLIPTTLGDGESGITIIMEDVTEAKRFERSLRENEEKYRMLFDNSRDGIILRNRERFFECNDTALKMFGCVNIDDLMDNFDEMNPDIQPDGSSSREMISYYVSRVEEEDHIRFDWIFRRMDDTDFHAEVIINRLILGEGPIDHIVIRDITDRKESEIFRIKHSQALKMSAEGICFTDLNGKIVDVNESFIKLMGFGGSDEMIGMDGLDLLQGKYRDIGYRNMRKLGKWGSVGSNQYTIQTRDGRSIIVENRSSLVSDEAGNPMGFVTFTRNIEDRKWTRDNLARVENVLSVIREMLDSRKDAGDMKGWIGSSLSLLGEAVEVSSVSLFRFDSDDEGSTRMRLINGWKLDEMDGTIPRDQDTVITIKSGETEEIMDNLSRGKFFETELEVMRKDALNDLRLEGMGYLLFIPIMMKDRPWGCIEFINRREMREWFPSEIEALATVSDIIGMNIDDRF
ncbi:MAG: PAS domain S-box protein [Thermoplasmatota archaeon]